MLPLQGWRHRKQAAAAFVVKPVTVTGASAVPDQRDVRPAQAQPLAGFQHGQLHQQQQQQQQQPPWHSDVALGQAQPGKDWQAWQRWALFNIDRGTASWLCQSNLTSAVP